MCIDNYKGCCVTVMLRHDFYNWIIKANHRLYIYPQDQPTPLPNKNCGCALVAGIWAKDWIRTFRRRSTNVNRWTRTYRQKSKQLPLPIGRILRDASLKTELPVNRKTIPCRPVDSGLFHWLSYRDTLLLQLFESGIGACLHNWRHQFLYWGASSSSLLVSHLHVVFKSRIN
jgi:hypothetical protein